MKKPPKSEHMTPEEILEKARKEARPTTKAERKRFEEMGQSSLPLQAVPFGALR
jgi:hypothetical protein